MGIRQRTMVKEDSARNEATNGRVVSLRTFTEYRARKEGGDGQWSVYESASIGRNNRTNPGGVPLPRVRSCGERRSECRRWNIATRAHVNASIAVYSLTGEEGG